ncbi:MAG: cofactor-independent phosphoglycerate mutase [Chloroflexi bacterium ADurb.Bin120]|jgi:2,3-bisphosphoglycerate-independent phosphoglycerate mutase|uniref:Putative 2,3-bisphosphoglycerate-independent phosphoglycerate mutase n=1 Tax=Candidatus Brevifilum fermentans TaxID=1986204 RepID=A0A1Y6K2D6_9CHLR|nr:2,3-bisphosphoglycerate-independent phosphoglycerate mutase [Brevefilum fermentans]OQB83275.1 MAG: cofactor-independent phosphoglycerate mutase [Chloroflexi bacterium ADurb.Bin120]SMX53845.1 putative 2,3-bisphosphoglycerate-independent phosphoglycerate mutase [Brevefilum fermentans]HOM66684.1 2,3-bisphosphoglycerate-independent phosphoglycerate mutase [Brevefilum fermentans]
MKSFYQDLIRKNSTKIVLVILDGLGGLPRFPGGKTELEQAHTPNLDELAERSSLGLTVPLAPGVTVGSGPGHLAIFGYDPLENAIGRGALEALGVDFALRPDDIAARGNFCTLDKDGTILDRRAGRLASEKSARLVERLREIEIPGVEFFVELVKEHRFAFVMRKAGLGAKLSSSDPLITGVPPLAVRALDDDSKQAAELVNAFIARARQVLEDEQPANGIMLRGFALTPVIPSFKERFGVNAAAIAVNGMYRGVARLAGMQVLDVNGISLADEFTTLEAAWDAFDFFYLHFKKTDTCGEAGDFDGKVRAIEEFDLLLPRLLALNPDVVVIGGDHSSPAVMKSHSWHPVPLLLYAANCRSDGRREFGERACAAGSLGAIPAMQVMPLAMAHADRFEKFGA